MTDTVLWRKSREKQKEADDRVLLLEGGAGLRKKEGRPKTSELTPEERRKQNTKRFIGQSKLVKITKRSSDPYKVLDQVIEELAKETAYLELLRNEKDAKGESTVDLTNKRVLALKILCDSILNKRQAAFKEVLNLKGPKFQAVFKYFLNIVQKTFREVGIGGELRETFFRKLGENLQGWEDVMDNKLKKLDTKQIEFQVKQRKKDSTFKR